MSGYGELLSNIDNIKNNVDNKKNTQKKSKLKNSISNDKKSFKEMYKEVNLDGYAVVLFLLWFILGGLSIYNYNIDIHNKIKNIPTLEKNIDILDNNIKQQEEEIRVLDSLIINDDELKEKEELLSLYTYGDNNLTGVNQSFTILEIAKISGIEITSFTKTNERFNERILEDFGRKIENLNINNFLENSWYNKFTLTIETDEESLLNFIRKIQNDTVSFLVDGYTVGENEDVLTYSLGLKALYTTDINF